jgi:hypothetical protein
MLRSTGGVLGSGQEEVEGGEGQRTGPKKPRILGR